MTSKVACAFAEQIEKDTGCGSWRGQEFYAQRRWMDAKLQCVEVEAAIVRNDEFAVENAFRWWLLRERIEHFEEVSVERLFIAILDENRIAVTKHQDAKTG